MKHLNFLLIILYFEATQTVSDWLDLIRVGGHKTFHIKVNFNRSCQ